jgi:hypothetical protein
MLVSPFPFHLSKLVTPSGLRLLPPEPVLTKYFSCMCARDRVFQIFIVWPRLLTFSLQATNSRVAIHYSETDKKIVIYVGFLDRILMSLWRGYKVQFFFHCAPRTLRCAGLAGIFTCKSRLRGGTVPLASFFHPFLYSQLVGCRVLPTPSLCPSFEQCLWGLFQY